jgi:hypothetical protein
MGEEVGQLTYPASTVSTPDRAGFRGWIASGHLGGNNSRSLHISLHLVQQIIDVWWGSIIGPSDSENQLRARGQDDFAFNYLGIIGSDFPSRESINHLLRSFGIRKGAIYKPVGNVFDCGIFTVLPLKWIKARSIFVSV